MRKGDRENGELGRGDQAIKSLGTEARGGLLGTEARGELLGTEARRELLGTGARGELLGTGVMRGRYYYIKC